MVEMVLAFVMVFTLTRFIGSTEAPDEMAKGMMVISLALSGTFFSVEKVRGWWQNRRPNTRP